MKKVIEVLVIRLAVVVVGDLVGVVRVLVDITLVFARVITFRDKNKIEKLIKFQSKNLKLVMLKLCNLYPKKT